MSVYVDDARNPYGNMLMCHMVADTAPELREMAANVGIALKWIQHPSAVNEHMDVCQKKRQLAVRLGAIEISQRDLARRLIERKGDHGSVA